MHELFKAFKKLTGYSGSDIAREFDFSREYVSSLFKNYSKTYKAAEGFMMQTMIDEKITYLELKIEDLEALKKLIKTEVMEGDGNNE